MGFRKEEQSNAIWNKSRLLPVALAALCAGSLLQVSCDAAALSVFPSYLTESETTINLSGSQYFPDTGAVEFYKLRVENPTGSSGTDTVLLYAYYYNGARRQIVFDEALNVFLDEVNNLFGNRMFIDDTGALILGNRHGVYSGTFTWYETVTGLGRDGYAGLWENANAMFGNYIETGSLTAYGVWADWKTQTTTYNISPSTITGSIQLLNVKTLYTVSLSGSTYPITMVAFRNNYNDEGEIHVYVQGTASVWTWPPAGYTARIGEEVHLVDQGIICHTLADDKVRLIGWNYATIASTNYEGRFKDMLFDYGRTGYYYVFDPATRRLFKVRDWWR